MIRQCLPSCRAACLLGWLLLTALAPGCGPETIRHPVPPHLVDQAHVEGYGQIRSWGDQIGLVFGGDTAHPTTRPAVPDDQRSVLALSGGGSRGAFGAGLLCGWSTRGDRPTFRIVTGISTGALIAPFAFLGSDYDARLRQAFTTVGPDDIYVLRIFTGLLRGDSLADNAPLLRLTEKYIDQDMLTAIAREHRRGRRLYIGTTNLDVQRPVVWDMGAIAASGHKDALKLFRRVLVASASIPVAFPPQYVTVQVLNERYDEMHVDGGVTAEVFIWGFGDALPAVVRRPATMPAAPPAKPPIRVYVIRNAAIAPQYQAIAPRVIPIAARSIFTLINSQALGDIYRVYNIVHGAGMEFLLAYIPDDDKPISSEEFNKQEMNRLFEVGYKLGQAGYDWKRYPPGFPLSERE
ncbi:MAG: Patatin-like phospholipase [Planctomycetes bacterium ADurb.Bin126]|nr:MAG: Patatin-like phospholipase [Planctomycetes bacterium ADurb.Bin126]HOD81439.1 patatin-like phospholipase family protein [Phycisphaerae bacterium]HQL75908.1 patatin-like phospholipase family protein [Phycisphaerae bacterium]